MFDMATIGLIGFMHETNTFAPGTTAISAFEEADAWPGLTEGRAIFPAIAGANLACAGFVDAVNARGSHSIAPLLWCAANPSGLVSDDAFERLTARMLHLLGQARPDALYLDLHGAMVTESHGDGEGELLRRIRALVGPSLPIVATLDFHANITAAMVELCDVMVAYREYPHVDMADTGRRAATMMHRVLEGEEFHAGWRKCKFLLPLTGQCTVGASPTGQVMELARSLETQECPIVQFVPGFPLCDTEHTGPAVLAYAVDRKQAEENAQLLYRRIDEDRYRLTEPLYSPEQAIAKLVPGRKAIFADTQDNPGGGGSGDTTGIIHALRAAGLADVCVGLVCDPQFASEAHGAGVGATMAARLGALTMQGEEPVSGDFRVEALGSGQLTGTGPYYYGCKMELGLMARVRIDGIDIVVASRKQQAADQAMFHHVGADFDDYNLLVLKSSVHFRADFSRIAEDIFVVKSLGANTADLRDLSYKSLSGDVEIIS